MSLRQIKWAFMAATVIIVLVLEYARVQLSPFLASWTGRALMNAAVLITLLALFGAAFNLISRLHERLERQNAELIALRRAGLDIHGEFTLALVLQKVVDQACQLVEARYGAVAVYSDADRIVEFVTSGIDSKTVERIGAPPVGKGLLAIPLKGGQRLRLADLGADPRAAGFPVNHPKMKSLLAVPIVCSSPFKGNLYVADKRKSIEFSAEDEKVLASFAYEASIAVDNSYVHQRLQSLAVSEERVLIGREMHDGMAQVLAYVNTKAQAAKEFLRRGRADEASAQLDQLAGAAREAYTDVREGILALRTQIGTERPLREALQDFVDGWQAQSGIQASVTIPGELKLEPSVELQLLRMIQEALANVRKHSRATHAEIAMRWTDDQLITVIADDGDGFEPGSGHRSQFPRFGLSIMHERAQSVDGALDVESSPGKGTRVTITVPVTT